MSPVPRLLASIFCQQPCVDTWPEGVLRWVLNITLIRGRRRVHAIYKRKSILNRTLCVGIVPGAGRDSERVRSLSTDYINCTTNNLQNLTWSFLICNRRARPFLKVLTVKVSWQQTVSNLDVNNLLSYNLQTYLKTNFSELVSVFMFRDYPERELYLF